jgi:hypothetical protein
VKIEISHIRRRCLEGGPPSDRHVYLLFPTDIHAPRPRSPRYLLSLYPARSTWINGLWPCSERAVLERVPSFSRCAQLISPTCTGADSPHPACHGVFRRYVVLAEPLSISLTAASSFCRLGVHRGAGNAASGDHERLFLSSADVRPNNRRVLSQAIPDRRSALYAGDHRHRRPRYVRSRVFGSLLMRHLHYPLEDYATLRNLWVTYARRPAYPAFVGLTDWI